MSESTPPDPEETPLSIEQRLHELEQRVTQLANRPGEEAHALYSAQQFLVLRHEALAGQERSFTRLSWLATGIIVLSALASPLYLQFRAEEILQQKTPSPLSQTLDLTQELSRDEPMPPAGENEASLRLEEAADNAQKNGQLDEALSYRRSLLLLSPGNREAQHKLIQAMRGVLLTQAANGVVQSELFDELTASFETMSQGVEKPAPILREWAEALSWRGTHSPEPQAGEFFDQAIAKFKACEQAGGDPLLYESWAEALRDRALRLGGKKGEPLFAQAYSLYTKALSARPGDPGILGKWAIALNQEGQSLEGEAGRKKMAEAVEKLHAVVKAKPDHAESLKNLAIAMTFLALRENEEEGKRLFREAGSHFEKAAKRDPKDAMIPYNWATSLFYQASHGGEEAEKQFQESFRRFEEAIRLSPDSAEIYFNWGMALREKALLSKEAKEADKLHEAAHDKFSQVVKRQPGHVQAWMAWSESLTAQSQRKSGAEKEALLAQAKKMAEEGRKRGGTQE